MKRLGFVVAALLVAAMVLTACGGSSAGSGGGGGTQNVTVTATEFKFDPATITVKTGDKVTLTLVNKGTVDHTYVQPDLNINLKAAAGQSASTTFTATKAGSYPVVCDVPGHKEAGMTGTIVVQ